MGGSTVQATPHTFCFSVTDLETRMTAVETKVTEVETTAASNKVKVETSDDSLAFVCRALDMFWNDQTGAKDCCHETSANKMQCYSRVSNLVTNAGDGECAASCP